jgi:hypothetical protein
MSTRQRGRVSKYTDDFKRKLVAESSADGVSVPMVAQRQCVPENRIYAWRGDPRFQRWSQDFGPVVKVDQLVKEMIQNDETKEPFVPLPGSRYSVSMRGGFQSQGCA